MASLPSENARLSKENEMLRLQCLQAAQAAAAAQQAALAANYYGGAPGYPPYPMIPMPGMPGMPHMPGMPPMHGMPPMPGMQLPGMPWPGAPPAQRARQYNKKGGKGGNTVTREHGNRSRANTVDVSRPTGDDVVPTGKRRSMTEAGDALLADPDVTGTTVMIRNVPTSYTRAMLLELIDKEGFQGTYDFVYLPVDFTSGSSLGYAFVNLANHSHAVRFREKLEGFESWASPSPKVCSVNWSSPLQGLEAHIERFRCSPVMHESVPEEHKPVLFKDGSRLTFPAPTKSIRAPRARPGRKPSSADAPVAAASAEA